VRKLTESAHGGRSAGDVYDRPVFARVRRQCLGLPGAIEALAWGHPVFKAGGKMFCAFEVMKGRPSIAFRLDTKSAAAALKDVRCFASPYGRGLWVSVWVDEAVDWKQVGAFVDESYRTVAPKRSLPPEGGSHRISGSHRSKSNKSRGVRLQEPS
jgi:predicted DNA-binding protein (MmcQ/YjbR family)